MAIMGLDVGTTGSKAVVFDLEGNILASAYQEYNIISPTPGFLELNPQEVLKAVGNVVKEVAEKSKAEIKSVALSTLGEAAIPIDKNGNVLGNAIVGFDTRGQEEATNFKEKIDPVELFKITGHSPKSFHTLFKLLYIKNNQPEVYSKIHKHLCFGDFIAYKLGFEPTIDYSMAARTLMFDVNQKKWSDKICELAQIDPTILANPAEPGAPIGTIGENELGFPKGATLVAGLHDQPAGILGAGIKPAESMLATGTVVCMGILLDQEVNPKIMVENNLCRYPTFGGRFINIAWNFTGGSALKWFRDNFAKDIISQAKEEGKDPYDIITAKIPSNPTKVFFLPYLAMTGTPFLDPKASGMLIGLRIETDRFIIAKSIMEGVAYEVRLNQELLTSANAKIELYKAIGGGAKSDVWMQIYSDVLNRPISVLQITESACWGVALLGGYGAGIIKEKPDILAQNHSKIEKTFYPDDKRAQAYCERFDIYRRIYSQNKELLYRLAEL